MPPLPTERRSFIQDYFLVQWLMQFPALTVMVILRRDLGYRLLNPLVLFAVTGLLAVAAILATPGNPDARPTDLLLFAVLVFAIGIYQRLRRSMDLNRKVRQHSYHIGSSPFDFHWLPNFVRRSRRVARFVDPTFCALIGVALLPYSRALAMWLILSGVCLRAHEDMVFRKQRSRDLDLSDSLIVAERQARTLEHFEQTQNAPKCQSDNGIPTGLGDDIEGEIRISIKHRKTKTNKPVIDI